MLSFRSNDNTDARLLEGRELPDDLSRRFQAARLSRQEHDQFRDRLWRTCPTEAELHRLTTASNPWEVLSELERRPLPPASHQARPYEPTPLPELTTPDDDSTNDVSPRPPTTPSPHTNRTRVAAAPTDPFAEILQGMSDGELHQFMAKFRRAHHLDDPGANAELTLDSSKLSLWSGIQAEIARRRSHPA